MRAARRTGRMAPRKVARFLALRRPARWMARQPARSASRSASRRAGGWAGCGVLVPGPGAGGWAPVRAFLRRRLRHRGAGPGAGRVLAGGRRRRSCGVDDDELIGVLAGWAKTEAWAAAGGCVEQVLR